MKNVAGRNAMTRLVLGAFRRYSEKPQRTFNIELIALVARRYVLRTQLRIADLDAW